MRNSRNTSRRCGFALTAIGSVLMSVAIPSADAQSAFRGLWCEVFDQGFKSASEVDTLISYAVQGNYNAILPEVLAYHDNNGYPSHGAFWDSNIVPPAPAVTGGFDPLAYLCQQAHANGIEVHPWIIPFRVSTSWPPPNNGLLAAHPEWFMVPQANMNAGTPVPVNGAYTLDPGSPDVQEYVVSIVRELIENYEIDGINFDRIRYSQTDAGYPVSSAYAQSSLARFKQITGYVGTPSPSEPSWCDFRRRTIDELIRRCRAEIATYTTHPRHPLRLSADTIVWGDAPSSFTFSDAYRLFQNWRLWMEQGWLDTNIPMNYKSEHCGSQGTWYRNWTTKCVTTWGYNRHTVIGQAGYMNSQANSIAQMSYALSAGAVGTVNYNSWDTAGTLSCPSSPIHDTTWYTYVRDNLFTAPVATPAMPWRDPATATEGTIWGRITDDATGQPVDDATVQVGSLPAVQTDGNGIYVVTQIPAPTGGSQAYTVTVTKPGLPAGSHPNAYVYAGDVVRYDFMLGAGPPTIEVAPTLFEHSLFAGDPLPDDSFTVRNSGEGALNYTITETADWLTVLPYQGSSHGETDTITIRYDTGMLTNGDHSATIDVFDTASTNLSQQITVLLHVGGVPGDFDADDDVDMEDFGRFQACLTGPGAGPPQAGCTRAMMDDDDDVDSADVSLFIGCMTGAGIPGDPDCANSP